MSIPKFDIPPIPYHSLLDRSADRYPQKDAIRFHDERISFAELQRRTWQAANWLSAMGVRKGDRIAVAVYNCPEYLVLFYAASRVGAIFVPTNASYTREEAQHVLADAGVRLIVAAEKLAEKIPDCPVPMVHQEDLHRHWHDIPDNPPPDVLINPAEDLLLLQYSSGTTGKPRAVMMSHRNLVASHLQYIHAGAVSQQDISLLFVPFVHVYGTMLMGGAISAGATQVVLERYHLERSLQLVEEHAVTLYYCTTSVVIDLVQSPLSRQYDLSSIRYINSGGAPLPGEVRRMARRELGIAIANGYGMTEAPIVGHLVPGEERRISDPDDPTRELKQGESGEIWVRGPQVMKGYWNDPAGTAEVLRDGWLRTGDIGFIDGKGRLIITARQKEMIKYKGFAVSPTELEGLLLEHPAVADCAVVGKRQADGNELPKAFLVLKNGTCGQEAVDSVNRRVAEYKRIREVEVVPVIPRNDAGKILKRLLA